jgi:hypothetical protein
VHTLPHGRPRRIPRVEAAGRRGLLLALVLLAAVGGQARAAPVAVPPQGVYEGCSPGTRTAHVQVCIDRLRTIRSAGFVIVLNYSGLSGSPEQVRAYARAADDLGIRLIWPIHHRALYSQPDVSATFRAMAIACGCSSPSELIPFMVGVVRPLPATFMYYVGDETPFHMHAGMAANSRLVAQSDPSHPRLFVSNELRGLGANLEPFADDADVLAGDVYPVATSNRLEDVADASRAVQRVADAHGRQSAMVLQAFSWGPDFEPLPERWPTVDEYHTMRDLALVNGRPGFLLWWAAYVIFRSSERERRWADLVQGVIAPEGPQTSPPPPPDRTDAGGTAHAVVPRVRALSARRHGRVVRVRFALTSPAETTVTAWSGHRKVARRVQGRVSPRTVALRLARGTRRVTVRVTPSGGRSKRLRLGARIRGS